MTLSDVANIVTIIVGVITIVGTAIVLYRFFRKKPPTRQASAPMIVTIRALPLLAVALLLGLAALQGRTAFALIQRLIQHLFHTLPH